MEWTECPISSYVRLLILPTFSLPLLLPSIGSHPSLREPDRQTDRQKGDCMLYATLYNYIYICLLCLSPCTVFEPFEAHITNSDVSYLAPLLRSSCFLPFLTSPLLWCCILCRIYDPG